MRILGVADEECKALWDYFVRGSLDEYDLIISCGDLKPEYLSFLVTMSHARLLYVPGNHDDNYIDTPPEGCDNIDGHVVVYNGVRILGLGGSMWYRPGMNQYKEKEMQKRVNALKRVVRKLGGVDIIVSHAPVKGYGDLNDLAHQGFSAFIDLIDEFKPMFFLHGHVHLRYNSNIKRIEERESTKIINVSERYSFDFPDREYNELDKNEIIWKTKHKEPRIVFESKKNVL